MRWEKKHAPDWMTRLQEHRQRCEDSAESWAELSRRFDEGDDIGPQVRRLNKEIQQIRHDADQLWEFLCAIPGRKISSVNRLSLTEQEYCFVRAMGFGLFTAKSMGVSPIDDFEAYRLGVYEDDVSVCFMDPNETPDTVTVINKRTGRERVRIRLAQSPEECAIRYLRPEQRSFYTKHRPDVLARMQSGDAFAARRTGRGRRGRIQE